jgi:hypothetical protein
MTERQLNQVLPTPIENPSIAATSEGLGKRKSSKTLPLHGTPNDLDVSTFSNNSPKAQCQRLLSYLQKHGSVTTMYAQEQLNIYDPPARKHNLVHKYGVEVEMTKVIAVNAQGYAHEVGLYTLIEEPMQGELL